MPISFPRSIPSFVVAAAAAAFTIASVPAASAQGSRPATPPAARLKSPCPQQLQHRSPEQVLEAHLAAVRSGNAALVACDYAKDAVFLLPDSVTQGSDAIEAVFAGFFQSAGAISSVATTSLTAHGNAILMTYTIDSERIVVSNGVDTFFVDKGRIVLQTAYLGGLTVR